MSLVDDYFKIKHYSSCSDLPMDETCKCGNNIKIFDWQWSEGNISDQGNDGQNVEVVISEDHLAVTFHPVFSSGTAVVKGNKPFLPDMHYFWEIKITTKLYGTDVMIGVGTKTCSTKLTDWYYKFCSMLGLDDQSWGFSYHGHIQHNCLVRKYGDTFGLGNILGVYLDTFSGTLEFYIDRVPLGVAFRDLKGKTPMYPMTCSTAAQSGIKLNCAVSEPTTLQLLCLKYIVREPQVYDEYITSCPALHKYYNIKYFWIVPGQERKRKITEDDLYEYSIKKVSHKSNKKSQRNKAFNTKLEEEKGISPCCMSSAGSSSNKDSSDSEEASDHSRVNVDLSSIFNLRERLKAFEIVYELHPDDKQSERCRKKCDISRYRTFSDSSSDSDIDI